MLKKIPKEWQIVTLLAIIKLIVHFLTNTNYELQRDAFLYYSLGEHPAWGYVSVPPFIGVVSGISTFLFGNTVFALRFFPALVGSISVFIIAGMVRELKGGVWAPDSIENAPLIYINHQTNNLSNLYNEIELVGVVDNEFFREDGVKVYYCIQPVDSLHMLYAHVVGKMKRKYKK